MSSEEIQRVLKILLDPDHPYSFLFLKEPYDAVRQVVKQENLNWSESQIKFLGMLVADDNTKPEAEALKEMKKAEEIIIDVMNSSRFAYRMTLYLHNVTFYLGIAIIILAVYASMVGLDIFSLVFGVVGFSTIAALFLRKPVLGVHRSIGTAIQLEIIYSNFIKQLGFWGSYVFAIDDDKKIKVLEEIREGTRKNIELVRKYCKPKPEPRGRLSFSQKMISRIARTQ